MDKKIIPVVFSSNDNFAPYLGVAIYSLIKNSSPQYEYRISVLMTELSRHHKQRLLSMATENVKIEIIDVSQLMKEYNIPSVGRFSPEATYRLLIDRFFPKYDKILYLDCDLIVNQDVAELYEIDLQGKIIGACLSIINTDVYKHITQTLGFSSDKYFNSGVLLIDIPLFSKNKIGEKALRMLSEDDGLYTLPDQDVLNILCENQVRYIDTHWNVTWSSIVGGGKDAFIDDTHKDISCYIDKPNIIHYTSPFKPWGYPEYQLAEYFWQYARDTVFYEEILMKNIRREERFSYIQFPWSAVKQDSRIIIYGCGSVGQAFWEQLKKNAYCHVVAMCCKAPEKHKNLDIQVIPRQDLNKFDYDVIVIAAGKKETAQEIKEECIAAGVPEEKIIWQNPMKIVRAQ